MKKQENPLKNQKGFTLIEIIAVLIILGILSAVAVPKYMDLQNQARIRSAQAAIAEGKARLSSGYGIYLLANNGTAPTTILQICATVNDDNTLPKDADGNVPMGADYTVGLTYVTSTATLTVTAVQGVALGTSVTSTWVIPS